MLVPPRPRTPRPRTPTVEEAGVLTVYLDAERSLVETVAAEVADVADLAQAGAPTDSRAARGARAVRQAVERTVLGLDADAATRVESVVDAAARGGADDAVRQLGGIAGPGRGRDHDAGFNRGAVDRLAAATLDTITPAHRAILRSVPDAYREVITRATAGALTGGDTRLDAAQRAMWALTDRGITSFTDARGRRWRLSSYVEMAVRTAAARAAVDAQLDRLAADGQDLVIVGEAAGECPRCARWEGKILAVTGEAGPTSVEHAYLDEQVVVDVAATVAQARSAGLLHPNCRHSLSLYRPGLTPPAEKVHDPAAYKATQRQREIERHIRGWKERGQAALTPEARRQAAARVKQWQGQMRAHLKAHPDLKRKSYREGIDAGNAPTEALRRRLPDGPFGPAVQGRARRPRDMTDDELDRRMQGALAREDFDEFERLAGETDRRDTARARRRDRDRAAREAREQQRIDEYDRLTAAGMGDEEAVERAFGITVERQRRERAIADLRANGYSGRNFDELSRSAYRDDAWQRYSAAEEATNGYLLSRRREQLNAAAAVRRQPGMDPKDLFTGPERTARANASDELLAWWDLHGRPTLAEFRADLLTGNGASVRAGRGDFLT